MTNFLLCSAAAFAVLLFGGTPEWVRAIVIILLLLAGLSAAFRQIGKDGVKLSGTEIVAALLFALPLGWALLATVPGSASIMLALMGADSFPAARLMAQLGLAAPETLSVSPFKARVQGLWMGAAAVGLAASLLASRRKFEFGVRIFWAIQAIILVACLYGAVLFAQGSNDLLWHDKQSYIGQLTGTFVNPNHFATLAIIGFWGAAGLVLPIGTQATTDRLASNARRTRRLRLSKILEGAPPRLIGLGLCLIYAAVLFGTQSSGGLMTFAATLIVVPIALLFGARRWGGALAALVAAMIGGYFAYNFVTAETTLVDDLLASDSFTSRSTVFLVCVKIIATQPWIGTGLGSFQDVFHMVKPDDMLVTVDFAHNPVLELALEIGIPATILFVASILLLFARLLVRRRAHGRYEPIRLMAVGGTMAIVIHSMFDFSVQIPGVSVVWLVVFGAALGQAMPHKSPDLV